jgi:hypothetical protein
MMTASGQRLSFGIKTSQMGLSYEEILRIWREADQIPVFEHAWLWDHMVPLRGEITVAGELPRNATGRVLRSVLREPHWAGHDRRVS